MFHSSFRCSQPAVVNAPAPPPPPGGTNAARIITALNGYVVPFTYNVPADPVIDSFATVNPSTLGSNMVSGRRLTLQAGAYGDGSFNVSNLDVICEAGVSFTSLTVSNSSVRITGSGTSTTVDGLVFVSGARTDIMFDNFHVTSDGTFDSIGADQSQARICFKNITNVATENNWGFIGGCTDLFFLRCNFSLNNDGVGFGGSNGSRTSSRVTGSTRLVFVNNRMQSNQAGNRFNNVLGTAATYSCIARNQFENTRNVGVSAVSIQTDNGGFSGHDLVMNYGWFENNNIYLPNGSQAVIVGVTYPENIQNFSFTNNTAYCTAANDSEMTQFNYGAGCSRSENWNRTYVSTPGVPANVGAT